jgi:glycosyltransferase involved in cell wall biosynthesis
MTVVRARDTMPVVLDTRVVTGSGGGPDKTILNSPRFLSRAGYRMVCAYMHPPGDPGFARLQERAEHYQAPLVPVEDRGAWDWRVAPRLLNVCRRERVAIWHGHDYKSNALGLLLARFWPMRLVTTVHGWGVAVKRMRLFRGLDRLCLPYYESVICVSQDLRDQCLAAGVPAERCLLLENAIDTDDYRRRQPRAEAKQRWGLRPERLAIGAVGRLSREKGFDLLIRATSRLVSQGHDVELVIAGEGDQRSALEALVAELGCGDRVRLIGYCADTRPFYEALNIFALSSLSEGLPNVLLEALALELPAVASAIAGVPRVVRDGENGLLVEAGSVDALADALARLVAGDELRQRLGQAGRLSVERDFGFAVRMQKMRALYDTLLSTRRISRPKGATR